VFSYTYPLLYDFLIKGIKRFIDQERRMIMTIELGVLVPDPHLLISRIERRGT
jgi:hypothetical protein